MLWQLFVSFMKIGAFTIGGGYAMLPIIESEVVNKRGWVKKEDWLDMVVLAQTAPGILAMNISVLVGVKARGKAGALVAALGSGLPSFLIILVLAMFVSKAQDNEIVERMFMAIRPAVVALIAVPAFSLGKSAGVNMKSVWYVVAVAVGIAVIGVSPIYIILGAILMGVVWTFYLQRRVEK